MKKPALLVLIAPVLLAACAVQNRAPVQPSTPVSKNALYTTDDWLGQWNGPEGTFLRLDGGGDDYLVTIRNLDGTRTFLGSRKGGTIVFERNGVSEKIRHSDGKTTGMKWLAEKTNCLMVKKGEGYCRGDAYKADTTGSKPGIEHEHEGQANKPDDDKASGRQANHREKTRQESSGSNGSVNTRSFGEDPDQAPGGATRFPEPQA